jgi:ribosome biogenesis GTPase
MRVRTAGSGAAVGDWVVCSPDGEYVEHVLARRSALARRSVDETATVDVIAANVDTVFLLHALGAPPNRRRLERELVLAYDSGAAPVVVLTKADLADDVAPAVAAMSAVALGAPVHAVSARGGGGLEVLRSYTEGHRTVALLGASGVGKSTLVNTLVGHEVQRTGEVRAGDQRGRHTTTAAVLIALDDGFLVDTPGLRSLAMWSAAEPEDLPTVSGSYGLDRAFADITELALQCRFANCGHETEPGCAVLAAVDAGAVPAERVASYRQLLAELERLEDELVERERAASRGRRPRRR